MQFQKKKQVKHVGKKITFSNIRYCHFWW